MMKKRYEDLRSARWFADDSLRSFGHRSRMMQMGYDAKDWVGRPIIAIINTWSDLNPCHAHFKERVVDVKRGVQQAGGFPVELPALSLSESDGQADHDALSQPAGDGDRGAAAQPSGRRRRAAGRLRQDDAGADHGRDQRRPAGDLRAGRADAARQLERQGAGLGFGRLEVLGRAPRRQPERATNGARSRPASRAATARA